MADLRRPGREGPPEHLRPLLPPVAVLRANLAAAEKSLARRPGTWPRLEAVGRGRRALGEGDWRAYLLAAVDARRAGQRTDIEKRLHVGNLLLLAGEDDAAGVEFEAVVAELRRHARDRDAPTLYLTTLLGAAFLLRDDRIVKRIGAVSSESELGPIHRLAALAEADRERDRAAAAALMVGFASFARESTYATSGAAPSMWDMAEMAAQVAVPPDRGETD